MGFFSVERMSYSLSVDERGRLIERWAASLSATLSRSSRTMVPASLGRAVGGKLKWEKDLDGRVVDRLSPKRLVYVADSRFSIRRS